MFGNKLFHAVTVLLVLSVLLVGIATPAIAQDDGDDDDDEDDNSGVIAVLNEVLNALTELANDFSEFSESWGEKLGKVLVEVIFKPFLKLLQDLVRIVSLVLTKTPDVFPNPAVQDMHQKTLIITYISSGLVFATAGILHIVGPVLGVSYGEVRKILPRVFIALVFATFSLPILQLSIDLSDAFVTAFAPSSRQMKIKELAGVSTSLVLVWMINSTLLLVVTVMFLIRDVYILFVAAISPLIALTWSVPRIKRYADTFIAGYWTALAMGPLDMLVLKFSFALLDGQGLTSIQKLTNWVLGVAAFTLLIIVPLQLYGASQTAVGRAYNVSGALKKRIRKHRSQTQQTNTGMDKQGDEYFPDDQQSQDYSQDRRRW